MNDTAQTPIEDLRKRALAHYDELSTSAHHYSSEVPKAINFYYDAMIKKQNRESEFWGWARIMGWLYLFCLIMTLAIAFYVRSLN